jgi:hypothetical protein
MPTEVWAISGPQLTPITTTRMRLAGVPMHVWNNWLGYLVAVASILVPLAVVNRIQRIPAGPLRRNMLIGGSVFGVLFLLPWLFVIALSNLSLVLLLGFCATVAFASGRLGSLVRRRAA